MPFLGYTQRHAGLVNQDQAGLGQPRFSAELPAQLHFTGVQKVDRNRTADYWAHGMYVPKAGDNFGRYYGIDEDGTVTHIRRYNEWYYSSAEYYSGNPDMAPVWGFANDYTQGWNNLEYATGDPTKIATATLTMNEITYDYNKGRMLGMKDGCIYEISLDNGSINTKLYDYRDFNNIKPITLAADLNGDIYFINYSEDGEDSYLFKFATDDELFEELDTVGTVGWAAQWIQTMAFDHNTGILYWWQTTDNGSYENFANFVTVDKTTGATTLVGGPFSTGLAGLFFEFDYTPHTVTVTNTTGGEFSLVPINRTIIDPTHGEFLPGENVIVYAQADDCKALASITATNLKTNQPIEVLYNAEEDYYYFTMPAANVAVTGTWQGQNHTVTTAVQLNGAAYSGTSPNLKLNNVTSPAANAGQYGKQQKVQWTHPDGYYLYSLSAIPASTPTQPLTFSNISNYTAQFTMPCDDVTVTANFKELAVEALEPICQYHALPDYPATTPTEGDWTLQIRKGTSGSWKAFNTLVFNEAGTYQYRGKYVNNYGTFYTATKSFQVYAAPEAIAIQGNQYCCENGNIELTAVDSNNPNATLNGTFVWTKDGNVLDGYTTANLVIENINEENAGYYDVTFTSRSNNNNFTCEVESTGAILVNVASLPNDPEIVLYETPEMICYGGTAMLKWNNGVLNPDAYNCYWFTRDEDGVWDTLRDADGDAVVGTTIQTEELYADQAFAVSIHYAGDYNLCHAESDTTDPFMVYVKEEVFIEEIMGDTATCQIKYPDVNPYIDEDLYTDVIWYFDGEALPAENGNELQFNNEALNGNLLTEAGEFTIAVEALDLDGCLATGEMTFIINERPTITITNDVDTTVVATTGDVPVKEIEVCSGGYVTLTAEGADSYEWGVGQGANYSVVATEETYLAQPNQTTVYQVTGYIEETGCFNSAYIKVIVRPLPNLTWVNPNANPIDTIVYSMIQDTVQLKATPTGGIFTWIYPSDPDHSYPIANGIFTPSALGIGVYQVIYNYTDPTTGCINEIRFNAKVEKPYWTDNDKRDNNWFANCQAAGRFEITNPAQMGAFAAYLNNDILNDEDKIEELNGDVYTFEGDTIYITNNIDLQAEPYFYRPLNQFAGVLDGTGKVVSNAVILENNLELVIAGSEIRNIGLKDAKVTNLSEETLIVDVTGTLHNSYVTKPTLKNVLPTLVPTGEVENVYYYGPVPSRAMNVCVYMDNVNLIGDQPFVLVTDPNWLLDRNTAPDYTGKLEEWVWLRNDFVYYDWVPDFLAVGDQQNYGFPRMNEKFIHHHYVDVLPTLDANGDIIEDILTVTVDGVQERDIDNNHYVYAMNNDTLTITVDMEDFFLLDSVKIFVNGYHGVEDMVYGPFTTSPVTFYMPVDSVYKPAYNVEIQPYAHPDYWTDEGNYCEVWYENCIQNHQFEITCPEDLAALAWMVDFGGYNFEGDTIYIVGATGTCGQGGKSTTPDFFLDMDAHLWRPIDGFMGILDGTHFIIDNLHIHEAIPAMFYNMGGVVLNLGVQDTDMSENDDEYYAIFNYNEDTMDPTGTFAPGTIYNSFFTTDPELNLKQEIAAEGYEVVNSYTLDGWDNPGTMITNEHEPITFDALQAWVHNQPADGFRFYEWKQDDAYVNYSYPIHANNFYVPGVRITYVVDNPDNAGGCYIFGDTTAMPGDLVDVNIYFNSCYNLTKLYVDNQDWSIIDSLSVNSTTNNSIMFFTMPDHEVTVHAEFAPMEWTLTIYYRNQQGQLLTTGGDNPYIQNNVPFDELYEVRSPEINGYELVNEADTVVSDNMPCGNYTYTVLYKPRAYNIILDPNSDDGVVGITPNTSTYTSSTTIEIELEEGLSFGDVTITAECVDGPIDYTGTNGVYTFTMPACDVTVLVTTTEEYWDDYGIRDVSWYLDHEEGSHTYILTTDSMLGGLAAIVTGRDLEYEGIEQYNFAGDTIILQSKYGDNLIDLIEHKWRAIGAQIVFDPMTAFQGYFDGNGHQIVNMKAKDPTQNNQQFNGAAIAMFGNVGEDAVLHDINIQGYAKGRYNIAGIAGVNYGTIINCVADVDLRTEFEAGGIAAYNFGYIYNSYCIADTIQCWTAKPSTRDLGTQNYYIGGIAGGNFGEIVNCHSVAGLYKGGEGGYNPINYYGCIAGYNGENGVIDHCYWTAIEANELNGAAINEAVATTPLNGNFGTLTNCGNINNNTLGFLNSQAAVLNNSGIGAPVFAWVAGEDYPVFGEELRDFMNSIESNFNVTLYPNPTSGQVKIESNNIQRVTVYNMFGQLVIDREVNADEAVIDMTGFAAGVYMVRIATIDGVATKNVIVK